MSMSKKNNLRRSGAKIMASLILLLGSLAYIMVLAVINGSVGFICAMGVTLMGAVGVAKALGETIALSYGMISDLLSVAGGCEDYFVIWSSIAITISPSVCLRFSVIRSSEHFVLFALQS